MVCNEECKSGCLGRLNTDCIDIGLRKCKNFQFDDQCVLDCSADGLYENGTQCIRCHEECSGTCKGPVSEQPAANKSAFTESIV